MLVNRLGTMALAFLVLYLTRTFGWSIARAGSVLTVYAFGALCVAPIAGRLSDRWGALRLMRASLLASGTLIALYPLAHTYATVVAMTILVAVTNEAFRPASYSLVGALAPPEYRKAAFALNRLALNLGMSVGPAAGGFLAQKSFPLLFEVNGLASVSAAIVL